MISEGAPEFASPMTRGRMIDKKGNSAERLRGRSLRGMLVTTPLRRESSWNGSALRSTVRAGERSDQKRDYSGRAAIAG